MQCIVTTYTMPWNQRRIRATWCPPTETWVHDRKWPAYSGQTCPSVSIWNTTRHISTVCSVAASASMFRSKCHQLVQSHNWILRHFFHRNPLQFVFVLHGLGSGRQDLSTCLHSQLYPKVKWRWRWKTHRGIPWYPMVIPLQKPSAQCSASSWYWSSKGLILGTYSPPVLERSAASEKVRGCHGDCKNSCSASDMSVWRISC